MLVVRIQIRKQSWERKGQSVGGRREGGTREEREGKAEEQGQRERQAVGRSKGTAGGGDEDPPGDF